MAEVLRRGFNFVTSATFVLWCPKPPVELIAVRQREAPDCSAREELLNLLQRLAPNSQGSSFQV